MELVLLDDVVEHGEQAIGSHLGIGESNYPIEFGSQEHLTPGFDHFGKILLVDFEISEIEVVLVYLTAENAAPELDL